jgi:hypothetical protein
MKSKLLDECSIQLAPHSCRPGANLNRLHLACLGVPYMHQSVDHHEARIDQSRDEEARLFLHRIRRLAPYSYSSLG